MLNVKLLIAKLVISEFTEITSRNILLKEVVVSLYPTSANSCQDLKKQK